MSQRNKVGTKSKPIKSRQENLDIEKEVEAIFSKWKEDDDKIDARRKVEEYLEMKRLREQIGDDLVRDED